MRSSEQVLPLRNGSHNLNQAPITIRTCINMVHPTSKPLHSPILPCKIECPLSTPYFRFPISDIPGVVETDKHGIVFLLYQHFLQPQSTAAQPMKTHRHLTLFLGRRGGQEDKPTRLEGNFLASLAVCIRFKMSSSIGNNGRSGKTQQKKTSTTTHPPPNSDPSHQDKYVNFRLSIRFPEDCFLARRASRHWGGDEQKKTPQQEAGSTLSTSRFREWCRHHISFSVVGEAGKFITIYFDTKMTSAIAVV